MSLQSAFISHQIWLQRYSTQEASTFEPYSRQLRNEIRAQVLGFGDDSRTKARLIIMLKDLEDALYGITSDWDEQLLADLKDLSIYESKFTAETLQKNVAANFTTPTPEQVWTAIKFQPLQLEGKPVDFTRLLASWSETEVSRLTMGVKTGFVQGLPTRQIVKQVIGDGSLIDVSERHVKAMVHTAIAHVSNQARETTYQKNNDIIEGYQWVSTLDRRTTPICRSRDGQKFYSTDDFQPKPPAHVGCRSTTLALISSEFDFLDKGAKRAARGADGGQQVDADVTYYDFLAKQPAWFQDEALGPVRGKIFRNSGMTPEEFRVASVDGFGNPLTIKEMAALDSRVADYLNQGD